MTQDEKTGRDGNKFGRVAGPLLIRKLGYERLRGPANVFMREGKCVALKCANPSNNRVGVYDTVAKRVDFVIAAFRRTKTGFDLYEMKCADYIRWAKEHYKPSRQWHAVEGVVVKQGRHLGRFNIRLPKDV